VFFVLNDIKKVIVDFLKSEYNINISEEDVWINKSKDKDHGDYSSNVFMKFSRMTENSPLEIGKNFLDHIGVIQDLEMKMEGPGFLNISSKIEDYKLNFSISKLNINDKAIKYDFFYLKGRVEAILAHYTRWNVEEVDCELDSLFTIERDILESVSSLGILGEVGEKDVEKINNKLKKYFIETIFNNPEDDFKEKRYFVLRKIREYYNS
jgi:hypothetical protein